MLCLVATRKPVKVAGYLDSSWAHRTLTGIRPGCYADNRRPSGDSIDAFVDLIPTPPTGTAVAWLSSVNTLEKHDPAPIVPPLVARC